LTAIYKDPNIKQFILKLAKSLGVTVDLIQPVTDNYVDRAIRGEHEGQITDEDYDPNGTPPGPEFKPTMPAGTVRVDVSDVYDWYKLGQNISNLDRVDPKIFGKGPPSTIMAFGSEPEEHKYINNLGKLGLTTTDIDPIDKNQPKGMKRQKVDPTYNVNEKAKPQYKNLDEINRRGFIQGAAAATALGALGTAPTNAQAGKYKPKYDMDLDEKMKWTEEASKLEIRAQKLLAKLIGAAGADAGYFKKVQITVLFTNQIANADLNSNLITMDVTVYYDLNDSALAFTIGHELGHFRYNHRHGYGPNTAANHKQEYDADMYGIKLGIRAGFDPRYALKDLLDNIDDFGKNPTATHPSYDQRVAKFKLAGYNNVKEDLAATSKHSQALKQLQVTAAVISKYLRSGQKSPTAPTAPTTAPTTPKQTKGVPNQKIGPTYNVNEKAKPRARRKSSMPIQEGISPLVYHYTRCYNAKKILSSGEFGLSGTLGSVEGELGPKGYPYFLSTTRTRHGGHHDIIGSDAVLFVLDGKWYSRHYKGSPVNYWLNRDSLQSHHKSHEAEDRIFSKDPTMSIGGVTAIHIYVSPDAEPQTRAWARQTLILAKRAGITAYFYTDKDAWRNQDTRKLGDVSVLKGQDTTRGYVSSHKGFLLPWVELINAKDKSQLSKKAIEIKNSLQYSYDRQSAEKRLDNDLSNTRKPDSSPDREHAVNIIKYMQANKLNTVKDLVNNLTDKWKSVGKVTEASGYIPSEKQKRDPRFKTALTVDVHPDSIQKNARAFNSKISRAGIPPIANPNGKF